MSARASAVESHSNTHRLDADEAEKSGEMVADVRESLAQPDELPCLTMSNDRPKKKTVRVTVAYEDRRSLFELTNDQTIGDLKRLVQFRFHIRPNVFPCVDEENPSKRVISMTYCGSELKNDWVLSDFGFHQGTTIKCYVKEERDPILYIYVSYTGETMKITDPLKLRSMVVSELKTLVSRRLGLPVSTFRVLSKNGDEMHSALELLHYDVSAGDTVKVEIWDGLNEYLNLCTIGLTSSIFAEANEEDEIMSRYMLRIACYVAAHFGYIDVAGTCLRNGIRPDEPVGDHPSRQWNALDWHPDYLKTPIHEAAERGQLGVLRLFVTFDIGCIMVNDGYGQKPLNLCLRNHHKQSASYLIARQWTKISYADALLSLRIINRMRRWADRAKERVLIVHGVEKSSLKRKVISHYPRVGQPVYVKGFHESRMNSRQKNPLVASRPSETYQLNAKFDLYSTDGLEEYFKTAWQCKQPPGLGNITSAQNTARVTMRLAGRVGRAEKEKEKPVHLEPPPTEATQQSSDDKPRRRNSITESWQSSNSNEQPKKSSCAPTLPQIAEKSGATDGSLAPASAGGASMGKKRSRTELAMARVSKVKDMQFPLPGRPEKSLARPYRYVPPGREDVVRNALESFKDDSGLTLRESAIQCLTVTSSFTSKSGPARVRMAIDIGNRHVRKVLSTPPTMVNLVAETARSD